MSSLKSQIRNRAGLNRKGIDNQTHSTYARGINNFVDWCKEKGINKTKTVFADRKCIIQSWTDSMVKKGYSAYTIHTYLAPVCKAFEINMGEIDKPKRRAINITKGRNPNSNIQGQRDSNNPTFAPTVDVSRATGFRRTELKKLKIGMLDVDESGVMAIYQYGKGNKHQGQRILPADQARVKEIFETARRSAIASGITNPKEIEDMYLFHPKQLDNDINYHAIRRAHGKEAYAYYAKIASTAEGREQLINNLIARWNSHHSETPKPDKKGRRRYNAIIIKKDGKWQAADPRAKDSTQFLRTLFLPGSYCAQKDNKARLMAAGMQTTFDRVAIRCMSVFHLAHWRDDVTIKHYFL